MQISNDTLLTLALVALAVVAMRFLPRLTAGVPFLDATEASRRLDRDANSVVIDVRTEGEYREGHVAGAINLPLGDLMTRIKDLGDALDPYKNAQVLLICQSANRSARAARILKQAGFTNLAVISGGTGSWQRRGLPIEK